MRIPVYFSEAGAAKTGLSPTVDIRDVSDGSLDVDDGAGTEIGDGWYWYDFSGIDASKEYTYLWDGGAGLCDPERYIPGKISGLSVSSFGVNVVTKANIDFGALEKTSLNAATPASIPGSVGSVTGAVGSVGGNVTGSVGSLATQAKADVNAEVLDVLNVDTFDEPGQEAPGKKVSLITKIGYCYKFLRNYITNDGEVIEVYNDAGDTVDHKATVSESGGTVTREKFGSGP